MVRLGRAVDGREKRAKHGVGGIGFEEGREFTGEGGLVGERELFGERFEEKIERVDDRHFGDKVDFDCEVA